MTFRHHSASSINSFISNRDSWFRTKILKQPFPNNPYFARGKAVEAGIEQFLINGKSVDFSVDHGVKLYEEECSDLTDEQADSQREFIEPMIVEGINFYDGQRKFISGDPVSQNKIKLKFEVSKTPLIGYTDFEWPSQVRDLKTASKTPSALSDSYKIQGAIYRLATNKKVTFDYIIPLKSGVKVKSIELTDDDVRYAIRLIEPALVAMDRIIKYIPEDMDNFSRAFYEALAFPNIPGMFNKEERSQAIRSLPTPKTKFVK